MLQLIMLNFYTFQFEIFLNGGKRNLQFEYLTFSIWLHSMLLYREVFQQFMFYIEYYLIICYMYNN